MADERAAPTGEEQGQQFRPGRSSNPAGRRKGSKNLAMQALDHVGQANAEDIIRVVVRKALAGDLAAAGIILSRCWVAPKGRPVQLDLPLSTPERKCIGAPE